MRMTRCLSPHVPPPQLSCVKLYWYPARTGERPRTVAWTCDCPDVYYELCESGGLGFIRRVAKERRRIVVETHRVRVGEAQALWVALLSGMAR